MIEILDISEIEEGYIMVWFYDEIYDLIGKVQKI
jgi:hypothetical protein